MKKLKTWQIVLLVIFYPVGICVWIYRVWKKKKLQKENQARIAEITRARAEAQERKEREKAELQAAYEAEKALQYEHEYKVVGVTFKNPDGKSRQTILQKMYFEKPPFNKDDSHDKALAPPGSKAPIRELVLCPFLGYDVLAPLASAGIVRAAHIFAPFAQYPPQS